MSRKKHYENTLKAKLALELLSGKKSAVELSAEHKIPPTNLNMWKNQLVESASELFLPESEKNKQLKLKEQEISGLHKVIGEITVENNFLKKKLKV
jgi:transposase-like protein